MSCNSSMATSFAGRDAGQMLAQDKANKEAIARRAAAYGADTPQASAALSLDHGPRAATTHRQWRLRAQAEAGSERASVVTDAVTVTGTPRRTNHGI